MSDTTKLVDKNTLEVMLVLTEKCNLSCVYCYEKKKTNKRMSFDIARKIIDKELKDAYGTNRNIVFQLFGGEPTLEWDLITKIYNYVKIQEHPNYRGFFVVTNGTLMNNQMKKWAKQHREDFIMGLSMDGTKEVHDYNRSNSYDLIDFNFFLNTWPSQDVKLTISPDMLPKMGECIIHCHELGFGVMCNLANGIEWPQKSTTELKTQLIILVNYYIQNPDIKPCAMLSMPLLNINKKDRSCFNKWCGCSDHMHSYNTEGECYPCQFFMEMTNSDIAIPNIQAQYPVSELESKCYNCPIMGTCPTCMGANIVNHRSPFYHSDVECDNIKLQFLATSKIMYHRYKTGILKFKSDYDEAIFLKNVLIIQDMFEE